MTECVRKAGTIQHQNNLSLNLSVVYAAGIVLRNAAAKEAGDSILGFGYHFLEK